MKTFTIENETNNITIHAAIQDAEAVANADRFRTEAQLARLAPDWPAARLVEIWNSLPGETAVKKFKDRATAVSRIWKVIQRLATAEPVTNAGPESGAFTVEDQFSTEEEVAPAAEAATAEVVPELADAPAQEASGTTQPEASVPESDEPTVTTDVAPQTPDVASEAAPANVKATRAKKAPKTNDGAPREGSKTSQVIAMLKHEGGVTLEEIMTAMGWQKHTTRAMLSAGGSLTKNHGITVISEKVRDRRRYSVKG
jgi:hypothetical protein